MIHRQFDVFHVAALAVIAVLAIALTNIHPSETAKRVQAPAVATLTLPIDAAALPATGTPDGSEFRELVMAAIGYRSVPAGVIHDAEPVNYRGGLAVFGHISYAEISTDVGYIYATHGDAGRPLITILHGHFSSPANVMGLGESDYMQELGADMFDRGYDVLCLATTSDMMTSEYLNGQLSLYGVQIYGLWAHAAITATMHVAPGHDGIYLYGLSNGGMIAQFVSVIDSPFDSIIVGDILTDWRALAKGHDSLHHQQNYSLFFLAPLWANASVADWPRHATTKTWYTRQPADFAAIAAMVDEADRGALIPKGINEHIPESGLIHGLLAGHHDDTAIPYLLAR